MKHWTILAVELCKYRVYIYITTLTRFYCLVFRACGNPICEKFLVNPGAVFSSDFQDEKLLTRLVPRIVKLIRHFWAFNVIVQLLILWVCNLKCVWEFHLFTEAATRFITVICWMSHLLHVTFSWLSFSNTLNSHLEIDWRITNDDIWYWYRSLKKRQDVVPKQEFDEKW